jgi:predicted MFS family arabinose efflux permease
MGSRWLALPRPPRKHPFLNSFTRPPGSLISPSAESAILSQATVWVMAVTVAVIVANIYYIQPLLGMIADTFHLTAARAGSLAMISQMGTALGMLFFVPLGDKFERRSLILVLLMGAIAALLLMAVAPNVICLAVAAFFVGAFCANVHVVVPFAAHLAAPSQRGRVVGTVVSGILFGVLLARTFSGTVGAWLGWRAVYELAAVLMLLLAVVVRLRLPLCRPDRAITWRELMRSIVVLVKRYPLLRESAFLGSLLFAGFSAFWTTLVFFLAGDPYRYERPSAAAGLFGMVGAVGALAAPTIGHLADKHGPRFTIRVALWVALFSFLFMGLAGRQLVGLICGVVLMDFAVQGGHVSNQTRIYGLDPAARSRLNTVYMFCYFVGGGIGSLCGATFWHLAGWWGVCGVGAAAIGMALGVEFLHGPGVIVKHNPSSHHDA